MEWWEFLAYIFGSGGITGLTIAISSHFLKKRAMVGKQQVVQSTTAAQLNSKKKKELHERRKADVRYLFDRYRKQQDEMDKREEKNKKELEDWKHENKLVREDVIKAQNLYIETKAKQEVAEQRLNAALQEVAETKKELEEARAELRETKKDLDAMNDRVRELERNC